MKLGGHFCCPFCLANMKEDVHTTCVWPIMRMIEDNQLILNGEGIKFAQKNGYFFKILFFFCLESINKKKRL